MSRSRRSPADSPDTSQEVFNDCLFNVLGLLLLLLQAAMAMVGVPDVSAARLAQLQDDNRRLRSDLAESESDLRRITHELAAAGAEADALRPRPVDVFVLCDGTVSMTPVLKELETALKAAAELGSRLSPRFRLGVVVYRDAQNCDTFPLTEIGRTTDGRPSAGMTALRHFIEHRGVRVGISSFAPGDERGTPTGQFRMASRMQARSGFADVESALRTGVRGLQNASAGTRRVLIVIGDMGPWEAGNPDLIDPGDRESAARCSALAGELASGGARVLALFTGRTIPGLPHREESAAFFRGLANAGRGGYSEDASQIAAALVEAALAPDTESNP